MTIDWNDAAIQERARRAAFRGVARAITIVEQKAVTLIMTPPKSGKEYRRRGVTHQASAPGEAPANDLGTLVRNRQTILDQPALRARLNFSAEYAIMLELGTKRMEPRPFAVRALEESREAVVAAITDEVKAEFKS